MSTLKRRVWPLKFIGVTARTAVLGAAIRAAARDEAEGIAEQLLVVARHRPDSLAVPHLVARWAVLSKQQRGELGLIVGADWPELIAYLAQDQDPQTRASAVRACADVGGPAVLAGPTVVALLADAQASVAEEAERTLGVFMRSLADRTLDAKGAAAARTAADAAIETFDHHRRTGALRLAIQHGLVVRGGGNTTGSGRWMADPDHPAHMVVRGLIRTSDDPAMRSCAWVWLKHPSLATACAERLTKADNLSEQSVVLERAHLALHPQRAAGLTASNRVGERDFAGALPRLTEIDGLSLAARRGLARWLEAIPVGPRLRDAASSILLTDLDAGVRQSLAITAACAEPSPGCLLDLVFDNDATVASTSADAVLSRAGADALTADQRERLAVVLTRSGHDTLRHLAAQLAQRPGGQARERAVAEAELLTARFAAEGPDTVSARTVASAVAGLAAANVPEPEAAERVLLRAAELPDARVRANAIEGLLRRARTRPAAQAAANRPIVELLLDRATDPHHRIRANAARGLLLCGWAGVLAEGHITERKPDPTLVAAGSRTLAALLADSRTMHRVAGLWLAHRLGDAIVRAAQPDDDSLNGDAGAQMLDRVTHACARAIDPMERRWADRARERLESSVRDRWSRRAPALEEAAA